MGRKKVEVSIEDAANDTTATTVTEDDTSTGEVE